MPSSLADKGWMQGSVFSWEAIRELEKFEPLLAYPPKTLFVILDNDCAVVNEDAAKEPFIEVVAATMINRGESPYKNRRNPRKLHLEVRAGGEIQWLSIDMAHRHYLNHDCLREIAPDPKYTFDRDQKAILISWLAARYTRSTFPDEFNRRIGPAVSSMRKFFEGQDKAGSGADALRAILGIYFDLDSVDELSDEVNYGLSVLVLVANDAGEENQVCVEEYVELIREQFDRIGGVELHEVLLRRDDEVTLVELSAYSRYDFDYLSEGGEELLGE